MAETKKKFYLKKNHGRVYVKRTLVVGVKTVFNKNTQKHELEHIPLTPEQVKLFSDKQKELYLEQR